MIAHVPNPSKDDNIVISLFHYPQQATNTAERMHSLIEALAKCTQIVSAQKDRLAKKNDFHSIFVAPEYLFADFTTGARQPLTEFTKEMLCQGLYGVSKSNPGILIVPGSFFYQKTLDRPDWAKSRMVHTGKHAGQRAGKEKKITRVKSVQNKLLSAMDASYVAEKELADPSLAGDAKFVHDTTFSGKNLGGKYVPSFNEKYKAVQSGANTICRNTTFLFLDGERLAKYDKQTDFQDSTSNSPDDLVFVPGTVEKQCPMIGGYDFGIEICFDHNVATLKRRNALVDFHIVLSDHVDTDVANKSSLKPGGYFLHASTALQETQLWWNDPGTGLVPLTNSSNCRISIKNVGGGFLISFVVALPAKAQKKSLFAKVF